MNKLHLLFDRFRRFLNVGIPLKLKPKVKELNVTFSASSFDEHYQMAYLYCVDKSTNYVFSLNRFPDDTTIEIMASDQVNHRVDDVHIHLQGQRMEVEIEADIAKMLDNNTHYSINFSIEDAEKEVVLHEALLKIFEGKQGLSIDKTYK